MQEGVYNNSPLSRVRAAPAYAGAAFLFIFVQTLLMMRHLIWLLLMTSPLAALAQPRVYTSDIDRFWVAYDSARTTTDTARQQRYIQELYIDHGTEGLKAFMKVRNYNAGRWVMLIDKYPRYWNSVRPNTLKVKGRTAAIESAIDRLHRLYPDMQPARMYFTVGALRSGGTTTDDMVLIGTEIAAADSNTDASELSDWLKGVFKHQDPSNIVALNVHEYVHTQQRQTEGNNLLSAVLKEGGADFIAELASGIPNNSAYMTYGRAHAAELKEKFKIDMYGGGQSRWLYNGSNVEHADLGYYMGYAICSAYYRQATDKKQAVRDIIRIDYANDSAVDGFLSQSGFYQEKLDKSALLAAYNALVPTVTGLSPDINHRTDVASDLTTLVIHFSEPMGDHVSISYGPGGKEQYPFGGAAGYSADHRSFTMKLALQPGHRYNFVITGQGFASAQGYPLQEYPVDFTTR